MDAALPPDPFFALTQRFAALDAQHEADYQRAKQVMRNGKAAVQRLKRSTEIAASGDTPASTKRMSLKQFSSSDAEHIQSIEEAGDRARSPSPTEVLSPAEMRARLERAVQEKVED